MPRFFVFLLTLLVRTIRAACRSHAELVLENLAPRQQVCALKQQRKPLTECHLSAFGMAG